MDVEIARLGGAARRVALGGNSQGGTVALHAALTHARGLDLACLVLGCTLLLDATPAPREPPEDPPPLFIFSAERDMEYLPAFQRLAFGRLAAVGFDVASHVEPGLDHYSVSRAELLHTAAWLRRALFGDAVVSGIVNAAMIIAMVCVMAAVHTQLSRFASHGPAGAED